MQYLIKKKKKLIFFFFNKKLVRLYVDYRIKPHVPPLKQIPANSVKF